MISLKKIADENGLLLKTGGENQSIKSVLQDNLGDLDFLYGLAFEYGYIMKVANSTLIITHKESKLEKGQEAKANLPRFEISLNECENLSLSEANRHGYTAVIVEWHDSTQGAKKQLKVGSGEQSYKLTIPEPKSASEAYKKGEAKLNELLRGGISGSLLCSGRELRAGGKLRILGVDGLAGVEFSIKSVSHSLSASGYACEVEFEG